MDGDVSTEQPMTLALMTAVDYTAALAFFWLIQNIAMEEPMTQPAPPPLLPASMHWAKRHKESTVFHIANGAGRLLCDDGPSVARSIGEPMKMMDVHSLCRNALNKRMSP